MKTLFVFSHLIVGVGAGALCTLQGCTTIHVEGNGNTISSSGTQLNREVDEDGSAGLLFPMARDLIRGH